MKRKIRTADIQIDIKDFILEFIRKAWVIGIFAVVFAVGMVGVASVQNAGKPASSVKTELTEAEKELIAEYEELVVEKEQFGHFIEDSFFMNLNSRHISITSMTYFIDAQNNSDSIASCYANYIESQGLAKYIIEKDSSITKEDVQELITVKILTEESNSGVLEIVIRGEEEAFRHKLEGYTKEALNSYKAELTQIFGEHRLDVVNVANTVINDSEIEQKQDKYETEYKELETAVNNMKTSLIEANLIENDAVPETVNRSIAYYVVIGALIGIVIAIVIIVLIYVMTDTIKTVDDLGNVLGLYCFGNVRIKKAGILNQVVDRLSYGKDVLNTDETIEVLAKKIYMTCENTGAKEILFVSNLDVRTKTVVQACIEKLAACDIKVALVENLNNSAEDVSVVKKDKPVIFYENLRKTKYSHAIKEVEFCDLQGADIWGYITVLY